MVYLVEDTRELRRLTGIFGAQADEMSRIFEELLVQFEERRGKRLNEALVKDLREFIFWCHSIPYASFFNESPNWEAFLQFAHDNCNNELFRKWLEAKGIK
jgi:hypothetical protein